MKRLVRPALLLLGLAGLVLVTRELARRAVLGDAPTPAAQAEGPQVDLEALDALIAEGLTEGRPAEATTEAREDASGTWSLERSAWTLPPGRSPRVLAEELAARLRALDPQLEVYVTAQDELDAELRVYAGKRALRQLTLHPTLGAPERSRTRPEIAVVLIGLGDLGPNAQALLQLPIPFTVTVEPFSPFALRHSWDATRADVELSVQVSAGEAAAAEDVLGAVYHPSAITLTASPPALPLELLYDRGMYIFDPYSHLDPSLRREAELAHVPVLRPDVLIGDSLAEDTLRLQHIAAERGGAIVAVEASSPNAAPLLRWLAASPGLRPVYLAERLPTRALLGAG